MDVRNNLFFTFFHLVFQGYILRVNGRNHGNVINSDIDTTKLSNLSLGNDIEVTLLALTNNTDALGAGGHQGQRHLELANEVEAQTQDPHDSGVESSSSVFVDKRSATQLQSTPLTLHLWGFVRRFCDVEIKQVSCCSALVQWRLTEEVNRGRRHDVYIDPEVFKVKWWKSEELAAQELEPIETSSEYKQLDFSFYKIRVNQKSLRFAFNRNLQILSIP